MKVTRSGRNIPKAFEIFTHDRTYVLKAKVGGLLGYCQAFGSLWVKVCTGLVFWLGYPTINGDDAELFMADGDEFYICAGLCGC